jgi:hypothetical protein
MGFLADVFAAPGAVDVDDLSMIQVLWEMPGSFASFAVAAYLNACSSVTPTYPLSPTEIQAMVNEVITTGSLMVDGTMLSVADAKEFLEQTMNL